MTSLRTITDVDALETLRPLGKLEQVSAACHHLGFFHNVGLSVHYKLTGPSPPNLPEFRRCIFAAADAVIRKHRILFAVPVNEGSPEARFAALPSIDLNRSITFHKRSRPLADISHGEDKELDAILQDQHNTNFKSEYGTLPFWRLLILQEPMEEREFTASFIYHHAIGDGVSGLAFHRAFRNALEAVSAASSASTPADDIVVPDKNLPILPDLWELHPMPINTSSPAAPVPELKEWTGSSIFTPCKSRWTSFYLSPSASKAFFQECKENGLSVTSALSSIVATVLFGILPSNIEALTCIVPVNLRPWLKFPHHVTDDAIGTYFDATKVQFTQTNRSSDIWPGARIAAKAVDDYLQNVSPSGEPYTAVAIFQTIPDVSVIFQSAIGKPRDAAFEVTNVGLFTAPKSPEAEAGHRWEVGNVLLSRSSVVSGAAVTVSAATGGNGSFGVGFSWQEGVLEDSIIAGAILGVKMYFGKYL